MQQQKKKKFKDKNNIGLDEGSDSEGEEGKTKQPVEYEAIAPFKEIYPHSDIVRALQEFGPSIVPLQLIGQMMNYAGNHLLHYIWTTMKRKVFFPMHKAVTI